MEHDTFHEYHTGLRQLFEVVRYNKEEEALGSVIEQNREAYNHMDSDTRELIEVVAGVKISEEYAMREKGEEIMEGGETRYKVCKAWEDHKLAGMKEYLVRAVCKKLQKNKSAAIIAEELEEELSEIEKVLEAQKKVGSYDVAQICRAMR